MVELGESNVPLTEDVIKKPPKEFSPTFSEWAADNVEQIVRSALVAVPGIMNYTVPDKHTLFITSAWITALQISSASVRHGHVSIAFDNGNPAFTTILLGVAVDHENKAAPTVGNGSISFPMPIRVPEKSRMVLVIDGNLVGDDQLAGFAGFLLPKKISIR